MRGVTPLLRVTLAASLTLTCAPPLASATPTPLPAITTAPASPSSTARTTPSPTSTASPSLTATPTPTSVPATPTPPGRAPYCAVDDVPTPERDYSRPHATVLDWTYALTRAYEPPDLVSALSGAAADRTTRVIIPEPGVSAADLQLVRGMAGYEALLADDARAVVRAIAYPDLDALRAAARAAAHPLVIVSAYRSYAQQELTFSYWVGVGGYQQALRTSARPGHSEHQLGTTLDFGDGSAAPWEYTDWAATPTGGWLAQHAAEFGFVMTYPAGSSAVTCYDYEPWHYRWVGREVATAVTGSRRTLREFQTGIR